jgi:hypothetical protein
MTHPSDVNTVTGRGLCGLGLRSRMVQATTWLISLASLLVVGQLPLAAGQIEKAAAALQQYRGELEAVREAFGGVREMPDVPFFLFGMGLRPKLIYRDGVLSTWPTGAPVKKWAVKRHLIVPPDYSVYLTTLSDQEVRIHEDEQGISIDENGELTWVERSKVPVQLPSFSEFRYPSVMRVLHQEIMVNVTPDGPVPSLFVYSKPWYRDGAMIGMCLKQTGNLDSIRTWAIGLREVFDRNNAGETEADNLGQALFLISLVSDKNHPLVPKILAETSRFAVETNGIKYIKGRSDFADRPVYQTKWLKYGLRALGLPDDYTVPVLPDAYSALFWMDYRQAHVAGNDAYDTGNYPYLGWACDHFHGQHKGVISNRDYPLSWEQEASQANYGGMQPLGDVFVKKRISVPHTWHAAEMFLYLHELRKN